MSAEQQPQQEVALPPATLDKYKAAGKIANITVKTVIDAAKEGSTVLELCKLGDDKIAEETDKVYNNKSKDGKKFEKGISHPTCISINSTIVHYSPTPSSETITLAKDDVVKVTAGAHIDGYASIAGETFVVGASASSPASGIRGDLLAAAYNTAEAALRMAKIGAKNTDVTDGVAKFLEEEYEGAVKGVEGMLSQQHEQNTIEGKKSIILFPEGEQRRDTSLVSTLEEGEVYALDIILTNGTNTKPREATVPTTVYTKTGSSYHLKMQTSRNTFSEISKKAGPFPFSLRVLDDEKRAKFGVQECVQHGLLKPFPTYETTTSSDLVAQIIVTFAITKTGVIRLTSTDAFYSEATVKPDHSITKPENQQLLAQPLKVTKKKNKPAA